MSSFTSYSRRIVIAAAGIGVLGAGMATSASAAPAALPAVSELPVPVVSQPIDASGGLLGIPRGSIPGIATPDLQQVPMANQLPGLAIVPLPDAPSPTDATTGPSAPAGTAPEPAAAADTATPQGTSGGSALAGLDDAGFMSGITNSIPAG